MSKCGKNWHVSQGDHMHMVTEGAWQIALIILTEDQSSVAAFAFALYGTGMA